MSEIQNNTGKSVGVEAAAANFTAVLLDSGEMLTNSYSQPVDTGRPVMEQLVEFVGQLPGQLGEFDRIGIAVPGLIRRETSQVAYSAHIPEHSDINIAAHLRAETGLSAIVENDANAAAYGEFRLGAGRGSDNLFYATLGRGIGGALILNGKIWHGASGFAGEFGYIAVNSDGLRLEDVASADNIVRRTRSRFNRDSTSSLNRLQEQAILLGDIISAAENGDDFARLMLERTGSYVGTALASVINLLNLEKIVLGGAIMHAGHLVLDAVIHSARELSFAPSFENTQIVSGTLGEKAAAVGAALLSNEN